ncbi:hypothetical protein AB0M97_20655, partial [Streptomyces sp. NPDC051207]
GAGAGLSKVGDISAALKGVGTIDIPALPANAIALPEGAVRLPDGTVSLPEGTAIPDGATRLPDGNVKLPDNATVLPPGTVKLPTEDGVPAQYLDPDGNILDEGGNVVQKGADGPGDIVDQPDVTPPASGADTPRVDSPVREPALVGAGAATVDNAGQVIRLGNDGLGDAGRVTEDVQTAPTVQAGGDIPRAGTGAGNNLPGGAADNLPGGSAYDNGPGPSASHEPPSGGGHDTPGGPTDGPGPGGGAHETPPTGGHEPPSPGGHESPVGGQGEPQHGGQGPGPVGEGNGGTGHRQEPPEVDYREGNETPAAPTGPMQPDQEAAVAEQLAKARMARHDIDKSLAGLGRSEYGAGIAKHIIEGNLAELPGYGELLSQCKQVSKASDMTPAVYMAMEHAADLQARGVEGLALELKDPGAGLDLDVLVKSGDRILYGAQLKDVDSAAGLNSATKGIAGKQLKGPIDGIKVAILDVHDVKAALTDKIMARIASRARMTEATFVLRFEDGSITIPANGPTYP